MAARGRSRDVPGDAVAAAMRLFAERGPDAVSVQDVAAAIKVSKQAVLHHFATKDGLVEATLERMLRLANEKLVAFVARLPGGRTEPIDTALAVVEEILSHEPQAVLFAVRVLMGADPALRRRLVEGTQPWVHFTAELLARGQRDGVIRPEIDPEAAVAQVGMLLAANALLLPLHGWTNATPADWRRRRIAEFLRTVRSMLYPDRPAKTARPGTVGAKSRRGAAKR